MQTSESIDLIADALSKAQGEFTPVKKSGFNQNFGKHYATLADVIEAVRPALSAHGLAYVQSPELSQDSSVLILSTRVMHASGQWFEATLIADVSRKTTGGGSTVDLQAWLSTLTSVRRVALSSMLGVAPDEDDDANAAAGRQPVKPVSRPKAATATANGNGHSVQVINETDAPCPHKACNAPPGRPHGTKCPIVTGEEVVA